MNVLVSSAGRRGALIKIVRKAVSRRAGRVLAIDAAPWSAACRLADDWQIVPRCDAPNFVDAVLKYCRQQDIQLIIPTLDTELAVYSENRDRFQESGITVAVSDPATIAITNDKLKTDQFLQSKSLPGVECVDPFQNPQFPLIIKPRFGSASNGVQVVHDSEELEFYFKRTAKPLVQQLASGQEYTVNFYVDLHQQCRVAVPHKRIETRGGEVSKCVTEKIPELVGLAQQLAQSLPCPWGAMCFQVFFDSQRNARIIEINPRFGGGYPIAHQAGVDFVELLIREVLSEPLPTSMPWRAGIAMTRWDDAVFLDQSELQDVA
ncbi:MAG: ATP-grasp domain-containing protein [Planctomycetes bacterium]|nr:ATP-grasp domain-containing protein [Planctomycetota bacterium]